ncbi:MAG: hypothetical protein KAU14_04410, partial [Thermoplasmata archaeon]|nr:hypothetical protein [Thermoplasmata archaeon]
SKPISTGNKITTLHLGDLNLDGKVDIIAGRIGSPIELLRNPDDPFHDSWGKEVLDGVTGVRTLCAFDSDLDADLDIVAGADSIYFLKNIGGTVGYTLTDTAPQFMDANETKAVLRIGIRHNGISTDSDVRPYQWELHFFDLYGDPMASDSMNDIFEEIRVFLDDGNGEFEEGVDKEIHSISNFSSMDGGLTLILPANLDFIISPGEENTYFLVAKTTTNVTDLGYEGFYLEFDPKRTLNQNADTGRSVSVEDTAPLRTKDVFLGKDVVISRIISISPNPGLAGELIEFKGYGATYEDTITRYVWKSNLSGEIHNGSSDSFTTSTLGLGTHLISLRAQSSAGKWSKWRTAELVIHERPAAYIESVSPNPATVGEGIIFKGHAMDDGSIHSYLWRTDDDILYNGTSPNFTADNLPAGSYNIYFSAMDNHNIWSDDDFLFLIVRYNMTTTLKKILLLFPSRITHKVTLISTVKG